MSKKQNRPCILLSPHTIRHLSCDEFAVTTHWCAVHGTETRMLACKFQERNASVGRLIE